MKFLLKLAVAALMLHALWQLGKVYYTHYEFQDSVQQAALIKGQSDQQLRSRILELAAENSIPLTEADFDIRRAPSHIYITGAYEIAVNLLPGYRQPLHLSWDVDAYIVETPLTVNP